MSKLLTAKLKLMVNSLEFQISLLLIITASFISLIMNGLFFSNRLISVVIPANQMYIGFSQQSQLIRDVFFFCLFPFVACLAYSHHYHSDYSSGTIKTILCKVSRAKYFVTGALVAFLSGFLVIVFPLLVNQLLCLIAAPIDSPTSTDLGLSSSYFYGINHMFFKELYANHPYVYNMLSILVASTFGGVLSLTSYCISLYAPKKKLLIVCIPGILVLLGALLIGIISRASRVIQYYLYAWAPVKNLDFNYFLTVLYIIIAVNITALVVKILFVRDEI